MTMKNIKKLSAAVCLCIIVFLSVSLTSFAQSEMPRLVDGADLIAESSENVLLAKLDEISERQKVDVVIVTTDSLDGKTAEAYADDFFDYNGYGFGENYDGILLLVSMENRDWHISTCGYGIKAFTDAGIKYISGKFLPSLSDGDYYDAFNTFAGLCDEFITQAKTGKPYDVGNLPKEPYNALLSLVIAVVAGFAVAAIVTGMMKKQLKSVKSQYAADSYVLKGSMVINDSKDIFLYTQRSRREKVKDDDSGGSGGSSTHTSSSGRTHGGDGGKF